MNPTDATAQIDTLIAKHREAIKLLEELKASLQQEKKIPQTG